MNLVSYWMNPKCKEWIISYSFNITRRIHQLLHESWIEQWIFVVQVLCQIVGVFRICNRTYPQLKYKWKNIFILFFSFNLYWRFFFVIANDFLRQRFSMKKARVDNKTKKPKRKILKITSVIRNTRAFCIRNSKNVHGILS